MRPGEARFRTTDCIVESWRSSIRAMTGNGMLRSRALTTRDL
jgi:hypothetical protein